MSQNYFKEQNEEWYKKSFEGHKISLKYYIECCNNFIIKISINVMSIKKSENAYARLSLT